MLAHLFKLGADMNVVHVTENPDLIYNAFAAALQYGNRLCVEYLIDTVGMDPSFEDCPTAVGATTYLKLMGHGDEAVGILKSLAKRGWSYSATAKRLEKWNNPIPGEDFAPSSEGISFLFLDAAMLSGSRKLLRYLLQTLRISITPKQFEDAKRIAVVNAVLPAGGPSNFPVMSAELKAAAGDRIIQYAAERQGGYVHLNEMSCACCGEISVSQRCSRCDKVRYCSKKCQREHWCSHKIDCTLAESGTSGPM